MNADLFPYVITGAIILLAITVIWLDILDCRRTERDKAVPLEDRPDYPECLGK
jgi:hypothetical protein